MIDIASGKQITFYEDIWLGATTLKEQYLNLYNIIQKKNATVSYIFRTRPLNIFFRRILANENLHSWHVLVLRIVNIHLNDQPDIFRWSPRSSGKALLDLDIILHNIFLWKLKIHLKIKVFLWLLYKKVILIKDNLVKKN
jgi:hypothetical protein